MDADEYNIFSNINTNGVTVANTFNTWRKSTNGIIQKLTVEAGSPTWDSSGKVSIGGIVADTAATIVDIGVARTGSGDAIINLGSVAAANNVVITRASGANGTFTVANTGTGLLSISQSGAGAITLSTNATERVRVLSGGNVGIGTSAPDSLLHVNGGNFIVSGTITSAAISGTNITASGFLNASTLGVGTSNTAFTVSSAGAIAGTSLGLGAGAITTSGTIGSGAITATSLNSGSGTIITSGQIKSSGIALNSNQVNAGNASGSLLLSFANYDGNSNTYNTVIHNGVGVAAVTVTGSTKAVTFAGALSGITTLNASGTITAPTFVGALSGNATTASTATTVVDSAITTGKIAAAAVTASKLSGAQTGDAPIYGVRAWVNFNANNTNDIISGATYVRSGSTTVTVTTSVDHNLAIGNVVYLDFTLSTGTAPFDGLYEVASVTSSTVFTIVSSASTASTGSVSLPRHGIRASGNVNCVSPAYASPVIPPTVSKVVADGFYVVNFAVGMPSTNYAISGSCNSDGTLTTSAGNNALNGLANNNQSAFITTLAFSGTAEAQEFNSVMVIR
jgi:hypothetical protein